MEQSVEILSVDNWVHVKVTGRLTKEIYEAFGPVIDEQIQQHGKIRILFEMHEFHGWTAGALWEDIKFDFHHWKDIERLAIVGESRWEAGMSVFCKPFTSAKIRYFDHTNMDDAVSWIEEE